MTHVPNTRLLKSKGSSEPAQTLHCPAQAPTVLYMPPRLYGVTGKWELGMLCTHPDMGPPAEAQVPSRGTGPHQHGPSMAEPCSAFMHVWGLRRVSLCLLDWATQRFWGVTWAPQGSGKGVLGTLGLLGEQCGCQGGHTGEGTAVKETPGCWGALGV